VVASFSFNRATICKWLYDGSEVGLKALRSNRSGRPRSLTPRHEQPAFSWVSGRDPGQYGLDFGLWQRYIVSGPVAERFPVIAHPPRKTFPLTRSGPSLFTKMRDPRSPPRSLPQPSAIIFPMRSVR
jgi:hypothetical protein